MAIEDFLLPGEEVLVRAGGFYATNCRLVRYARFLWWQELDEVSYAHLVGLPLLTRRHHWLAYLGLVVLLWGVLGLVVTSVVGAIMPDFKIASAPFQLLLLLGIGLALAWFLLPSSFYQVRAMGLGDKEAARWRISRAGSDKTRKLIATIREQRRPG